MANVQDSSKDLSISIVLEGFATIVSFTANVVSAHPGDTVTLNYMIRNDGATSDTLFGTIVDIDANTTLATDTFTNVIVSGTAAPAAKSVVMPARALNLRLIAGHVQ